MTSRAALFEADPIVAYEATPGDGLALQALSTPVVEANRAVAVAMAEGPAAGLVILDTLAGDARMARWPQLHMARADLLVRLDRKQEAAHAYRLALELEPPEAERAFIAGRLRQLAAN